MNQQGSAITSQKHGRYMLKLHEIYIHFVMVVAMFSYNLPLHMCKGLLRCASIQDIS